MAMNSRQNGHDNGNGYGNGNGNGRGNRHRDLLKLTESDGWLRHDADGPAPFTRMVDAPEGGVALTEAERTVEEAVREILVSVGEDPERDGLQRTPYRVAKMYRELLGGYDQELEVVVNGALFDVDYGEGEMVTVADIAYDSLCEHHMLPFSGRVHVAYIPRDKVVGLSKIPRIVDMFARRLQIQERLGEQIAAAIEEALDPLGVMVVVEGQHSCAALRGVKKHGVNMVSTARRGEFRRTPALRDEFYRLIGR